MTVTKRRVRPSRRRWLPALAVALAAGAVLVAGQALGQTKPKSSTLGPGAVTVNLTIRHSHFEPDRIQVAPGSTVRFVIDNRDPIGHEFIIGDAEVHRRHEAGTEPVHPPRPGEVSIPALSTAETTFEFDTPDSVLYACHLPGHFRYGMSGYVDVLAG
jgi:uncharacterized cupredoxin-like copper-binding protein